MEYVNAVHLQLSNYEVDVEMCGTPTSENTVVLNVTFVDRATMTSVARVLCDKK